MGRVDTKGTLAMLSLVEYGQRRSLLTEFNTEMVEIVNDRG